MPKEANLRESPSRLDISKFSQLINPDFDRAYLNFWAKGKEEEEPEICSELPCIHVSEITYGTARSEGIAPQMIAGLEAEKGLCAHAREVGFDPNRDEIQFVCLDDHRYWVRLELPSGREAVLVGTVDAFVFIPPKYGGPVLIPLEKKTGHYRGFRNPDYGMEKHYTAKEQLVVYALLTRAPAGVIQADYPRNGYLITHEAYLMAWAERPEMEEKAWEDVKRRVEVALRMKERGHKSWKSEIHSVADLGKYAKPLGSIGTGLHKFMQIKRSSVAN